MSELETCQAHLTNLIGFSVTAILGLLSGWWFAGWQRRRALYAAERALVEQRRRDRVAGMSAALSADLLRSLRELDGVGRSKP